MSAKSGIKYHPSTLAELMMTKRQFYNSLSQLKGVSLIEKYGDTYFHTTHGGIVYQQLMEELSKCQGHMKEMRIIDSLKHVKEISKSDIDSLRAKLLESEAANQDQNNYPAESNSSATRLASVEFFSSYEQMLGGLASLIGEFNDEILIATRVAPDAIIKQLIDKAKQGVKIKILADLNLIKNYLKIHSAKSKPDSKKTTSVEMERYKVITNPWYPYDSQLGIDRRVTKVSFGMIIFDMKVVGIELVDSYKPQEFTAGLLMHDARAATIMKEVYQRMSDEAVSMEDSSALLAES